MSTKIVGEVKFFLVEKGYGFITSPHIDQDVFFHFTSVIGHGERLVRVLEAGDRVMFNINVTPKGMQAKEVELADG